MNSVHFSFACKKRLSLCPEILYNLLYAIHLFAEREKLLINQPPVTIISPGMKVMYLLLASFLFMMLHDIHDKVIE